MIGLGAALGLAAAGYGMSQANNLGTMFLGNELGKKNMALQAAMNYSYAMKMAQNGPSASVAGLRKAGLNPILAATDGSFATPSFNGTSPSFPSAGSGGSNTMADAMAIKQSDANIDLAKSQADLNDANAKLAGVRAANEFANRGLNGNAAVVSRLLSSFGFNDKEIQGMLPMFEKGKSTPNGSVKSEGEVKMSHVASHEPVADFKNLPSPSTPFGGYSQPHGSDDEFEDREDAMYEYARHKERRTIFANKYVLTSDEKKEIQYMMNVARHHETTMEEFFASSPRAMALIRKYKRIMKAMNEKRK